MYGGTDNVGNFHHRTARELEQVVASGGRFRCFVNPDDPEVAILYRELRPEMLVFATPFVLICLPGGVWVLNAIYQSRKQDKRSAKGRRLHPQQPWLWQDDWQKRTIKSSASGVKQQLTLAFFVNVISWPGAMLFCAISGFTWPTFIFGSFAILGVPMAWLAWKELGKAKRGEVAVLHLGTATGVIGGHICGNVVVDDEWHPSDGFLVVLSLYQLAEFGKKDAEGTDRTRLTAARRQWQRRVQPTRGSSGKPEISFSFRIPEGLPSSTFSKGKEWQIEVIGDRDGSEGHAKFVVPVFAVNKEESNREEPQPRTTGSPVSLTECVERCGGRVVAEAPDCIRLHFQRGRRYKIAIGAAVVAILPTWALLQALSYGSLFFVIIGGAFSFPTWQAAINWFRDGGEVHCDPVTVAVVNATGDFGKSGNIPHDQLRTIKTRLHDKLVMYQIVAITHGGEELTVLRNIQRLADANAIARSIRMVMESAPNRLR